MIHPFVIGEVALGDLRQREAILGRLSLLPVTTIATDDETLHLVAAARLYGSGLGYVDAHLLASTTLTAHVKLWTRDKRLRAVAERLGVAADVS